MQEPIARRGERRKVKMSRGEYQVSKKTRMRWANCRKETMLELLHFCLAAKLPEFTCLSWFLPARVGLTFDCA